MQIFSMQVQNLSKLFFAGVLLSALFLPLGVIADVLGDQQRFSVDSEYDIKQREELDAVLQVANSTIYFYIEKTWWASLSENAREQGEQSLIALADEFEQNAYPRLTQTFGSEWKPGIDNDPIITVLFHEMREHAGGYTNYGDEFLRLQNPKSNEREMIYLNAKNLQSPLLKSFLAHEFVHVITFNQKNRLKDVTEEVWLNEVRAEYASTLLGYDLSYETSVVKQRVENFLSDSTNSLTEWFNITVDYGAVHLFSQYLVDQYGVQVLADSLNSHEVGIVSLNDALAKGKFEKTFTQVFSDWLIALFLNDCSYGERYCYHNPHLVNFRIIPQTNFLPGVGNSTLTLNNSTKDWAGNWVKILGGQEVLEVKFQGNSSALFDVPYIIENVDRTFSVHTLELNLEGGGSVVLPKFNSEVRSIIFLPFSKTKSTKLEEPYLSHPFSFVATASSRTPQEEDALISQLLSQIEFLRKEIARLQTELALKLGGVKVACNSISGNLFFGMKGGKVSCLQEFLKAQGEEIYPEGLVTGNFGPLTLNAVIRFQEKYADDILTPVNLAKGNGYVGFFTRAKINSFLP